tara:strand:+ start:179 stop:601 length:423 start_codon:yes stop_codon:yes gene_type:complete
VEAKWMLLPMFAQVVLTMAIMQLARTRRLRAVNAGEVNGTYFKTQEGPKPPRYVLQSDQMVLNFFETPMLFFAAGLAAMTLNLVNEALLGLGWVYVVLRLWHAQIKLTHNKLGPRALIFAISVAIILFMWIALLAAAFAG